MTSRFDETNTEGYSHAELDELNRRFAELAKEIEPTLWEEDALVYGSTMDALAERVLAEFDRERQL